MVRRQGGILDGANAGDITRWMAMPWQADTSSCLSGYNIALGQYLPTFWPARVPNDVLTEADYQRVMDNTLSDDERVAAFGPAQRAKWPRHRLHQCARSAGKDRRPAGLHQQWLVAGGHRVASPGTFRFDAVPA
jgi:hypothetical protein